MKLLYSGNTCRLLEYQKSKSLRIKTKHSDKKCLANVNILSQSKNSLNFALYWMYLVEPQKTANIQLFFCPETIAITYGSK